MTLDFVGHHDDDEMKPRITVFGVGGAGGNAVNNMIAQQLEGVDFVVANTDAQALQNSSARERIQIGPKVTAGLGAGAKPSVGAAAAQETLEDIVDRLHGVHMCFITAGMGGGTGTGAAPVIAQAAREMGILTVGVVTKPFQFEGSKRMRQADEGVSELQKHVDTLIIIPNQNLFRLATERTTFTDAFAMADDVLYQGVKGVTDLMVRPGLINLDFADVRSVMDEMGKAMMGTGEAAGESRAREAAERAIANPLLDDISLNGARGVLINITGGHDMTLFEMDEAAGKIREQVDPDANIIVGSTLDPEMEGMIRVSVVATGIETEAPVAKPAPAKAAQAKVTSTKIVQPTVRDHAEQSADARIVEREHDDHDDLDNDGMPEPAYQPRQSRPSNYAHDVPVDQYTARQPANRHESAPEVMDRLRRAVADSNRSSQPQPRHYGEPQPQPSRKSPFGRMLGRMTGAAQPDHGHHAPAPHTARIPDRAEPRYREDDFEDLRHHEHDENSEMPQFLRRQGHGR